MKTFAERLKNAMRLRNKTQTDIATHCHIDKGNLSHYLKGDFVPKQDIIVRIANYLNVLPTYLMGLTDQMTVYEGKQFVSLTEEGQEEVILIKEIISEIQAICSYEDVENLKVILNVVKTLARHGK